MRLKRKDSCTFKREIPLEIQERIYLLVIPAKAGIHVSNSPSATLIPAKVLPLRRRGGNPCFKQPISRRHSRESGNPSSSRHVHHGFVKVIPIRVSRFDQFNLPLPVPLFEPLFPHDRVPRRRKGLIVNQAVNAVPLGEALHQSFTVLPRPPCEAVGHANVKRPARSAGEDVNVILARHRFPIVTLT